MARVDEKIGQLRSDNLSYGDAPGPSAEDMR